MFEDKRKFKRAASNVLVRFRKDAVADKDTKQYLQGVAKDCGLGGMFLTTDHLMEKGSVVTLNFLFLEEEEEVNIQAKAIVRWAQRFRKPKGMGLEFFEFTGLEGMDFEQCLEKLLQQSE